MNLNGNHFILLQANIFPPNQLELERRVELTHMESNRPHILSISEKFVSAKLHINKWKNSHYPNGYYVNLFMFSTSSRASCGALAAWDFPRNLARLIFNSGNQLHTVFRYMCFRVESEPRHLHICWAPTRVPAVVISPNARAVFPKKCSHKLDHSAERM